MKMIKFYWRLRKTLATFKVKQVLPSIPGFQEIQKYATIHIFFSPGTFLIEEGIIQ